MLASLDKSASACLRPKTNTSPPAVSRSAERDVVEALAPQHDGVFDGLRVIGPPDAGDRKSHPLVQQPRRIVRLPYLERGARRPHPRPIPEDVAKERRGDTPPPVARAHREVV